MALRDLRTNLKSLQFGDDTPGGGSSGLPYIKNGLPEDSPAGGYLTGIARNSMDWPLRGGAYSTVASTTDSVRISRFLTDLPRGYVFTSKQVQLQKSNPKIETGGFTSRLNTQTYNLNANLLAQVFEQGTGIHIPRAGANPNELGPDNPQAKYEYIVSHKDTNQNRLVALYGSKIQQNTTGLLLDSVITKLGISPDDNILFDYEMGPDSLYGDGNTTIFKATDFQGVSINTNKTFNTFEKGPFTDVYYKPGFTFFSKTDFENVNKRYSSLTRYILTTNTSSSLSQNFNSILITGTRNTLDQQGNNKLTSGEYIRPEKNPSDFDKYTQGQPNYFGNTMAYSKLLSSKANSGIDYNLQDFRSKTIDNNPLAENYNDFYIPMITRIGIGSPGARKDRSNPYIPFVEGQDKINMSPIYRRNINTPVEDDDPSVRDLIKFCIESIDNGYPDQTNRMHFRAFITNFSDNIGAEWNSKRYMGRGENFYNYQVFTREVGFTFIVAAQSVEEMEKIYQKVNYLASTLHPDYQDGTGFMRGTIHKLTIGEYFYRTSGIITTMNINVDDNYPWEIKMKQPEMRKQNNDQGVSKDQLQMEVPQILKIQMNFKPIMDKLPQKGLKEPIIISEKVAYNYLSRENFRFSE